MSPQVPAGPTQASQPNSSSPHQGQTSFPRTPKIPAQSHLVSSLWMENSRTKKDQFNTAGCRAHLLSSHTNGTDSPAVKTHGPSQTAVNMGGLLGSELKHATLEPPVLFYSLSSMHARLGVSVCIPGRGTQSGECHGEGIQSLLAPFLLIH